MEARKDKSKKAPELRKDARNRRFQIEKLEERIAPSKGGIPGPPERDGHCPPGRSRYCD